MTSHPIPIVCDMTDAPDTAAGLDLLKAYQCRTSLTPAQ